MKRETTGSALPIRAPVLLSALVVALPLLVTAQRPALAQANAPAGQNQPALTPEEKAKLEALKKRRLQQQAPPQQPATKPAVVPKVVPKPPAVKVPPPPVKIPPPVKAVTPPPPPPDAPRGRVVPPNNPALHPIPRPPVNAATPPPPPPAPPPAKTVAPQPPPTPPPAQTVVPQPPPNPPAAKTAVPQPPPNPPAAKTAVPQPPPNLQPSTSRSGFPAAVQPPVVAPKPVAAPPNLEALKQQRQQIVSKRTNAVIIKEPDNRTIIKKGNQAVIVHNEAARLQRVTPAAQVQKQKDGSNLTIIERPNNVTIYNITDNSGQLIRRYRRDGDGNETDLIDNRRNRRSHFGRNLAIGLGIGAGIVAGAAILHAVADVPPPQFDLPPRKYVVDYEDASEDEVYEAFSAPPVDVISRRYTLDEVRATPYLRERMRRVDLNDINFDTGSWDVSESQYPKLERVARAMLRVIERNPNEVFLIEGYTDAVGAPDDNLSLSDRRAESVAVILSEQFQVPAENLTTQGYGEQYLKIATDGPERANRRVAVRRITPLISRTEPQ